MNFYSLLCVIPDFIPDSIIKILLDNKSEDYSPAQIGLSEEETIRDYRKTKWLNLPPHIHQSLYDSIGIIHNLYLKPIYNTSIKTIEPPQFLRYDIHDHYDKHNDSESYVNNKLKRVMERDISLLLYLNDDYEGGELEFTKLQLTIKPKKGMLIAFPSYDDFEHKVHPVTKGVRYNIVSWINTENRIYERPYDRPLQQWVLPNQ
jgi:Rps23 Pro-64 3,4-dihydroxylase Tpa1-like proline 4-hydroxylase